MKKDNANLKVEGAEEMKPYKIFFVLILTIPFSIYAQHLGGNGRGDVSIMLTSVPLPVKEDASSLPTKVELAQNYPNPFNPSTKIKFVIPSVETSRRDVSTTLKVYDVLGNEIATLVNEKKPAGTYEVEFNTNIHTGNVRNLPSGVYLYRLQAENSVETKKMLLIK